VKDLDAEVDTDRTWESNRETIKISVKESVGYYELKKHKLWFEEGCSN
jgi:hypothetical protein